MRLIAIDRPGFGRSDFQPNSRSADWPADVLAQADHLGLTSFGIVGHSGAGLPLFACGAMTHPQRLKFIGALGPGAPIPTWEVAASLNRVDRDILAAPIFRDYEGFGVAD